MLGVKELLINILTSVQNIKQKLNKPIIISQSIMTEAKDCGANGYCITDGSYITPSGYRAFAAHVTDTTNVRFLTRSCYFIANSKVRVYGYNPTSSTMTNCQARVEILYQLIGGGVNSLLPCLSHFLVKRGWRDAECEKHVSKTGVQSKLQNCRSNISEFYSHSKLLDMADGASTNIWKTDCDYRSLYQRDREHVYEYLLPATPSIRSGANSNTKHVDERCDCRDCGKISGRRLRITSERRWAYA